MEEDIKDLAKFENEFCNIEDTLEPSICEIVNNARKKLIEALKDTRHRNRDTQTMRKVIKDLELPIKANSKKEE